MHVKPDSVHVHVKELNLQKQRWFDRPLLFHTYFTKTLSFGNGKTRELASTIAALL